MRTELNEIIETARATRGALRDGKISVKEANAIGLQNHSIISVYALDLRERMFAADEDAKSGVNRLAHPIITPEPTKSQRGIKSV